MRKIVQLFATICLVCGLVSAAWAGGVKIEPPTKGWPVAFPIVNEEAPLPPNALELPQKPAYVPTLPGFVSGTPNVSDFGKKVPKHDGIVIKGSKVFKDKVIIPPGGLAYLDDTWRGMLPMLGEQMSYLGENYYFVDFVQTIRVKENVELPIGERVVIGDHWLKYVSAPGHELSFRNATVLTGTLHGVEWAWAGLSPAILPIGEDNWFDKDFRLAYLQGEASEITPKKITFDYITGTHFDSVTVAKTRPFSGLAETGKTVQAGKYQVKIAEVDPKKESFKVQILDGKDVVAEKVLGPVIDYERLTEDSEVRENLILTHDSVSVSAIPWPEVVQDGKANVNIYSEVSVFESGMDWPSDPQFAFYPMACPIGHYFGAEIVNKKIIILNEKDSVAVGPDGYFKIVIDEIEDGKVTWHVEDNLGNKSIALGGPEAKNIDLLLGKGRAITGLLTVQATEALQTLYDYLQR